MGEGTQDWSSPTTATHHREHNMHVCKHVSGGCRELTRERLLSSFSLRRVISKSHIKAVRQTSPPKMLPTITVVYRVPLPLLSVEVSATGSGAREMPPYLEKLSVSKHNSSKSGSYVTPPLASPIIELVESSNCAPRKNS